MYLEHRVGPYSMGPWAAMGSERAMRVNPSVATFITLEHQNRAPGCCTLRGASGGKVVERWYLP